MRILVVNAGSSSIKFQLFDSGGAALSLRSNNGSVVIANNALFGVLGVLGESLWAEHWGCRGRPCTRCWA